MGSINTMLTLDGESQFRRALNNINANLKSLEKELEATSTEFVTATGKMNQNAQISSNYTKQLDLLYRKQDVLRQAVANANKTVDDNKNKIAAASTAYEKTGKKIDNVKEAIGRASEKYGANSNVVKALSGYLKDLEKQHQQEQRTIETSIRAYDRSVQTQQRYRQQLADTQTAINHVQNEERRLAESTASANREVEKHSVSLKDMKSKLESVSTKLGEIGSGLAKVASTGFKAFEISLKAVNTELEIGLKGFQTYITALGAAGAAIAGFAVKSGATFEESMSKVAAYSGVSADELERLATKAKQVGATTSKTASEAADALGYLSLNGYKTNEMLATLEPIVKASEAGSMDLATAANLTARSLTAYGKGAEDAEEFLSILTATQNNSSTSLEQLLNAYVDMSGSFKSLGVDMKESATILGVFANQGVTGAEAATALNAVMLRLVGSNKKASAALESIGVHAWNDDGSFRGLTETLRDLGSALSNMTAEEETLIEAQIGGVMRVQDLKKLIAGVMDDEGFNAVANPIENAYADGTLYKTAETMLDNFKGRVTILGSATEALGNSIFDTFGSRATRQIEKFTEIVNIMNVGVKGGTQDLMGALTRIGPKLSKMLTSTIMTAYRELPSKLKVFNKTIKMGTELLLQALEEGIKYILPELLDSFTDLVLDLVDHIPDTAKLLLDGAVTLFGSLLDGLEQVTDKIVDEQLPELIDMFLEFVENDGTKLFDTGIRILSKIAKGILDNLDKILDVGGDILEHLGTNIVDNLPKLLQTALDIIDGLVERLIEPETLDKLVDAALDIMETLGQFLFDNIDKIVDKVPEIINSIVNAFCTYENEEKMITIGTYLGGAIVKGLVEAVKGIFNIGVNIAENGVLNMIAKHNGLEGSQIDAFRNIGMALLQQPSASTKVTENANGPDEFRFAGPNRPNVDFYGPVYVNNQGDIDSIINNTNERMAQQMAGGGRY